MSELTTLTDEQLYEGAIAWGKDGLKDAQNKMGRNGQEGYASLFITLDPRTENFDDSTFAAWLKANKVGFERKEGKNDGWQIDITTECEDPREGARYAYVLGMAGFLRDNGFECTVSSMAGEYVRPEYAPATE